MNYIYVGGISISFQGSVSQKVKRNRHRITLQALRPSVKTIYFEIACMNSHLKHRKNAFYAVKRSFIFEAAVAQGHKGVTVTRQLGVRSPLERIILFLPIIFINIFIFFALARRQKSGVVFRHSICNVLKISAQSVLRNVLTYVPLPTLLFMGYSLELI